MNNARKKAKDEISPTIARMVASGFELCDQLAAGVRLEHAAKVTWVRLPIVPSVYGPDDVRRVRETLNATQADLAAFLGSSLSTVRSWEQGQRPVPKVVRRYLDDLLAYPQLWTDRMVR